MQTTLHIDAYVDVICPWCWIGKRHLEKAIATLAQRDVTAAPVLRWHPAQLLPNLPAEGVPFESFYLRRLGSAAAVRARQAQVNAAAAEVSLHIDFSRIPRIPNSALALRLLAYTGSHGSRSQASAAIDRLFQAHFLQGYDIGDRAIVLDIAQHCGLNMQAVAAALDGAQATPWNPGNAPPSGVPYFVFNGQLALAGAQPPHVLLQAMLQALDHSLQACA